MLTDPVKGTAVSYFLLKAKKGAGAVFVRSEAVLFCIFSFFYTSVFKF